MIGSSHIPHKKALWMVAGLFTAAVISTYILTSRVSRDEPDDLVPTMGTDSTPTVESDPDFVSSTVKFELPAPSMLSQSRQQNDTTHVSPEANSPIDTPDNETLNKNNTNAVDQLVARIVSSYIRPASMLGTPAPEPVDNEQTAPPISLNSTSRDFIAYSYINKKSMISKSPESFSEAWITYQQRSGAIPQNTVKPVPKKTSGKKPGQQQVQADAESVSRAMFFVRLAESKKNDGLMDEAIASFQKALEIYPQMEYANRQLGLIFLARGKYEQAIFHLVLALDATDQIADTLNELGTAYLYAGKNEDALSCFTGALQSDPANLEFLFNRGLAFRRLHRISEAREIFSMCSTIDSTDARPFRELAVLDLMETNRASAIAQLEIAIKKDPTWYTPLLDAALIYAEQGDTAEAINYLYKAMDHAPAWVVYRLYQQPDFKNIRLMPESRPLEARIAEKARQQM